MAKRPLVSHVNLDAAFGVIQFRVTALSRDEAGVFAMNALCAEAMDAIDRTDAFAYKVSATVSKGCAFKTFHIGNLAPADFKALRRALALVLKKGA